MVLKKSNSGLNSGATQRITGRGTLKTFKWFPHNENTIQFSLTVSLTGETQVDVLENRMQNIWDYLEWNGPNIYRVLQNKVEKAFGFSMNLKLSFSSMNKSRMWLLPQRIQKMMRDAEFLQEILPSIDIHVTEIQAIPNVTYARDYLKKIVASEIISKEIPKKETKKSRKQIKFHNRGIQRSHLFVSNPKPDKSVELNADTVPTILDIEVCQPFHVDARCANKNNINRFNTHWGEKFKKSLPKKKGHMKGRYAFVKGYSRDEILEDSFYTEDQSFKYSDMNTDYEDNVDIIRSNKKALMVDIYDLIVPNNIKVKKPKKIKVKKELKEKMNCISDLNHVARYTKGVYIVLPKEVPDSLNLSTYEILQIEDFNDLPDAAVEPCNSKHSDLSDDSHSVEFTDVNCFVEKEIEEFQQNFIDVSLFVPIDELQQLETNCISNEKVILAKCYPPCLVVDLNPKINLREKCYLIAKKTDMNSSSWHVTFQCENYIDANVKLQRTLFEEWTCSVKLKHLISLALGVMESQVDEIKKKFPPTQLNDKIIDSDSSLMFCHPEKVMPIISPQTVPDTNINDSHDVDVNKHFDVETHECPVCLQEFNPQERHAMKLLPCGHIFCLHCWQSHVYNSMRQGDNKCTCMAFKCDHLVDMATILALVPFHVIIKWQKQMLEKCIDTSPYCSWCPKATCPYVAWSPKIPLKTQFGIALTCKCSHSWCSSCRNSPHWPVSCEQMAAYNKLLGKTGSDKGLIYDTAQFLVKLKPCPFCNYPIEKNGGCPQMVCRMCSKSFCWNCLKDSANHSTSQCSESDNNFVTYNLQNKLVFDLPLKYFSNCLKTKKKYKIYRSVVEKWLQDCKKQFPSDIFVIKSFLDCMEVRTSDVLNEAKIFLMFLVKCYEFQEMFYLLMGFAEINKCRKNRDLFRIVLSHLSQLHFVMKRIKEHILGKPLVHIYKARTLLNDLLSCGEVLLSVIMQAVPILQELSKTVDVKPIEELDPLKHLRYK